MRCGQFCHASTLLLILGPASSGPSAIVGEGDGGTGVDLDLAVMLHYFRVALVYLFWTPFPYLRQQGLVSAEYEIPQVCTSHAGVGAKMFF